MYVEFDPLRVYPKNEVVSIGQNLFRKNVHNILPGWRESEWVYVGPNAVDARYISSSPDKNFLTDSQCSALDGLAADLAAKANLTDFNNHVSATTTALAGKQPSGNYAQASHNHDESYAGINHNHDNTYEAKNVNIQAHIASAHAPSDAQKNSDITKAEIEAKLTGEITSHTHPGGSGSLELGETQTTAYRGDRGKTAYDHSQVAHAPSGATVNSTDAQLRDRTTHTGSQTISTITDLQTTLDAKASTGHNHNGIYEPANANIQSHIASAHAPSDAQRNSDITKAEIEAKLTGLISSHSHAGGSDPFTAKLILASNIATGANVTPVNLTGMSFAYEANATYVIEFYMVVQAAAATTGHGFGVNCTTAPVLVAMNGVTELANTGTTTGWQSIANNAIVGITSGIPAANTNTSSTGQGVLRTHATTAGTCQFIFRSETTAVTTCMAGSVITVIKVS